MKFLISYLGERLKASGGNKTAVIVTARMECIKFREREEFFQE